MFDFSQKNVVIELTKTKKEYFVVIKPCDQEKQVFCYNRVDTAYRQILRFIMGYLTGYSEKQSLDYDKLNTIITTLSLVFDVEVKFVVA